jgi:tRNA threonylcarbamoyladenosine biosynthesis protein TsaE
MQFTVSLEHLNDFAQQFWKYVNRAKVFAFYGQMGAGKTTIITALCREKGVKDVMSSPTFSIINEYSVRENGEPASIFHIDLYRLNSIEEILQTGVDECISSGSICMVEWPEKAPSLFEDGQTVHVTIEPVSIKTRHIQVKLPSIS